MPTCPKCGHQFDLKSKAYTEEFLTFWTAYDAVHKSPAASKLDAFKAWNQIGSYRPPLQALLYAVKGYQAHVVKSNGLTCHPSTWLRQGRYESFLPTDSLPTDSQTVIPSQQVSSVHTSWGEKGILISSEIGKDKFNSWFKDAELTSGTPNIITVGTSFRRDYMERYFCHALFKVLGPFEIKVRA